MIFSLHSSVDILQISIISCVYTLYSKIVLYYINIYIYVSPDHHFKTTSAQDFSIISESGIIQPIKKKHLQTNPLRIQPSIAPAAPSWAAGVSCSLQVTSSVRYWLVFTVYQFHFESGKKNMNFLFVWGWHSLQNTRVRKRNNFFLWGFSCCQNVSSTQKRLVVLRGREHLLTSSLSWTINS